MQLLCVLSNWELWRQGSFHHLPALIFHFTAKTSADFSIFLFFLLNFLPVSVSLIQIQHLGVSCAAFLRVAVCCFDLFLGCVKQTNAGAAPLQLPHWCSSAQCGKSTPNADICHIHLAASVKPSLPFPSPPHPNQVTSYFPAVSERGSDATWPNHPDGWAVYAFPLIYSCVYSSILPSPFSETKKVLSRYIRCDLWAPQPLAAPLEQKQTYSTQTWLNQDCIRALTCLLLC